MNFPFNPLSASCKVLTARGCTLFLFRFFIFFFFFFPPSGSSGDGKFPSARAGARCKLQMRCRYLQHWETHDVGHACGASTPRRAHRMSAAAGGAECFCCSSSYVSSGWLIKNIARHHSYFMGHLQNELSALSACLHTRVSMCTSACCRFCFFFLKTSR